ncbi:MAG: lytic transglycosylase domain-containing protein [Deltaproteobacteria bacterium]|nr:lytic transglycosylase domain-containing protein [Deltaproteobacteria bacterium]
MWRPNRNVALAAALVAVVSVVTPKAVADETIGRAGPALARGFTTLRDPAEFIAGLVVTLPRPTVVLTREDAVAWELLETSRSLSEGDALQVARALCDEAWHLDRDPLLLLAVIHVESFYDHLAVSPRGAEGLMQLMPPTAKWTAAQSDLDWTEHASFDPVLNVRLGARYLDHLLRQFGRLDWALTAYNRGPTATWSLLRNNGELPPAIVDFYAAKVIGRYRRLEDRYGSRPRS